MASTVQSFHSHNTPKAPTTAGKGERRDRGRQGTEEKEGEGSDGGRAGGGISLYPGVEQALRAFLVCYIVGSGR